MTCRRSVRAPLEYDRTESGRPPHHACVLDAAGGIAAEEVLVNTRELALTPPGNLSFADSSPD